MFAYQPQTSRAGEFIGQGILKDAEYRADAAAIRGQAMSQLGQDIGGAIQSLAGGVAGAYTGAAEAAAAGDSAYEALGAISEMYPGMKGTYTALSKMDDRTRRLASTSIMDNFGALSQFAIAGMNDQTRQQGQQLTRDMPTVRADTDARAKVAGGQGRINAASIGYNPAVISRRRNRQTGP
jgi:hypothetical protein